MSLSLAKPGVSCPLTERSPRPRGRKELQGRDARKQGQRGTSCSLPHVTMTGSGNGNGEEEVNLYYLQKWDLQDLAVGHGERGKGGAVTVF